MWFKLKLNAFRPSSVFWRKGWIAVHEIGGDWNTTGKETPTADPSQAFCGSGKDVLPLKDVDVPSQDQHALIRDTLPWLTNYFGQDAQSNCSLTGW
ncbi:hypothetical protein AVEN_51373-1 [Araneus ventricosus]|uniref:Uncharacterized protein n=1 Tax=Araneus ventricosus TaxID=182803 RepID=A0A4Y2TJR7_ARAVE|nr:hypothetical protein AVEN_51373-1 [Araneus ventricosus]